MANLAGGWLSWRRILELKRGHRGCFLLSKIFFDERKPYLGCPCLQG
jgi:hypothetical protein